MHDMELFKDMPDKPVPREHAGPFVEPVAKCTVLWPSDSVEACKRVVYASIDKPIDGALKEEPVWLYHATSKTLALKRFQWAYEIGVQLDMDNQRAWEEAVVGVQGID